MPGTRCSISVCSNSVSRTKSDPSLQHVIYHSFPKDKETRKRWIHLCCRKGKWKPDACRICSEHFTPDDYVRDLQAELLNLPPKRLLKKTAVPSINIGKKNSLVQSTMAKKRCLRQERRANKKLIGELLLRKYDQDYVEENASIYSLPIDKQIAAKSEPDDEEKCIDQEESSEEYVIEYLEDAEGIIFNDNHDSKSTSKEYYTSCNNCATHEELKKEHELLKESFEAMKRVNHDLTVKLKESENSVRHHEYKLNKVEQELKVLQENKGKEHMIVQSKCEDGMYEVFVVVSNEGGVSVREAGNLVKKQ